MKNSKNCMHWNVPPDALPGSAMFVRVLDLWLNWKRSGFQSNWAVIVSARATVSLMLNFLETLKVGPNSLIATTRVADVIVNQFKQALIEMGMVTSAEHFETAEEDAYIRDIMTADKYVSRVFVPQNLPSEMSTKVFQNSLYLENSFEICM